MNIQTIAANLLRLRKQRGFTQEQLAESAELSRGAYRNLEKGRVSLPHASTLKALSHALNIPLKELLAPVKTLQNVRFRSLKRLKSRDQVLADVTQWLYDFADLENMINETRSHNLTPLWQQINRKKSKISDISVLTRQHFELNDREPVHDICGLLTSQGIKVHSVKIASDAFLGLSVLDDDIGSAVTVNTWDRIPVETWIFSAAHELGHLLLHMNAYDVTQEEEDKKQEKEANQFASHFLMPAEVFMKEWEETAGLSLVDRIIKVKRVFRVSWRTVLYRVSESCTKEQRIILWKRFNEEYKQRYNRSLLKHDEPDGITKEIYKTPFEPAGMESHDFREDRLSLLVRKAVEQEIITLSRGAEILRLSIGQMRELSASWVVS